MELAQENHGLVNCAGSSGSKPSCMFPVPPVVSRRQCSNRNFSAASEVVSPYTASAMGQM